MTEKKQNALKKLEEIKPEAEAIVKEFNQANKDKDLKAVNDAKARIDKIQGEYAVNAKVAAFEEIIELGEMKPGKMFLEAVKMLEIEYLRVKITEDKDTKISEGEIEYRKKRLDPLDVEKHWGSVIGAEAGWEHEIDRFGFRLALRIAKMLGVSEANIKKISDSYSMTKLNEQYRASIAKEVNENGDLVSNPISNTQMIDEMQKCVDMCLGKGYKVTSHDVNFMLFGFTKIDPKNPRAITVAALKQTRDVFMNVMSNLVKFSESKNSGYILTFKEKKDKNKSNDDGKPFTPTGNTAKTEKAPEKDTHKLKAEEPKTKSKSRSKKSEPKEEKKI